MNSDISNRIKDFSLPKRNAASDRAISVLPTPVGPRNRKEPAGRLGDFRPARERRMARASAASPALGEVVGRLIDEAVARGWLGGEEEPCP